MPETMTADTFADFWQQWQGTSRGGAPQVNANPPINRYAPCPHGCTNAQGKPQLYGQCGCKPVPQQIAFRYALWENRPIQNAAGVDQQFSLAHAYRNKLVECEHEKDRAVQVAVSARNERFPAYERLSAKKAEVLAQHDEVRAKIQAAKVAQKTKNPKVPHLRVELRDVKRQLKELSAQLAAMLPAMREDARYQRDIQAAEAACLKAKKAAKEHFQSEGLYWPTEALAREAHAKSVQASREYGWRVPRFRRWDGSGLIGVQVQTQHGNRYLTVHDAFQGRSPVVRLERTDQPKIFDLWLRIGSDRAKPIWAVLPLMLHRPLPPHAWIAWVKVVRKRIGPDRRTTVSFVLQSKESFKRPYPQSSRELYLNFGWRKRPHGLRVAYWVDSDGREGEVVLPEKDARRWRYCDLLQSMRRNRLNLAIAALREFLAGPAVPKWLKDATKTIGLWKSGAQLAGLVRAWRTQRFAGDLDIVALLDATPRKRESGESLADYLDSMAWYQQDVCRWRQESHMREKAIAWRDGLYRELAHDWAGGTNHSGHNMASIGYGRVHYAKTDWRKMQESPAPEEESIPDAIRTPNRRIASPAKLQDSLKAKVPVTVHDAKGLTSTCHACGSECEVDGAKLEHTCEHCRATWDQDANHCRNLRARALALKTDRPHAADATAATVAG